MKTNNVNKSAELLMQENIKLYEENMRLKLMLEAKAPTTNKNTTNKETKSNKATKKVENAAPKTTSTKKVSKEQTNKKETPDLSKMTKNNDSKNKSLSKFQTERENKKDIVAKKRKENVPVSEIAKLVNQSEPTVRNYIRELKVEGRLEK